MAPTLSKTARAILTAAAAHPSHTATAPTHLPAAARLAVVASMLKQGLLDEAAAFDDQPVWRTSDIEGPLTLRATSAGLAMIAQSAAAVLAGPDAALLDSTGHAEGSEVIIPEGPTTTPRLPLRAAARALLTAWDATAHGPSWLAPQFAQLRTALASATRQAVPRQPRPDTKRAQVVALLRRPEGATVTDVAEATAWARHTVHGFFAGLKKTGIQIEVLERVRQVGPGKQGASGSYTVYRIKGAS